MDMPTTNQILDANVVTHQFQSVWDLEKADNLEDSNKFSLFISLLDKLAVDKTSTLPLDSKFKKLYHFSTVLETEAAHNWVRCNWPTIYKQFKTKDFHQCKNSDRIVCNVLRHIAKWMNNHYNFTDSVVCEIKCTSIKKDDKWVPHRYSIISF